MVAWEEIEKTPDIVIYDTLQYLRDGRPPVRRTSLESPRNREKGLLIVAAGCLGVWLVLGYGLGKAMGWW